MFKTSPKKFFFNNIFKVKQWNKFVSFIYFFSFLFCVKDVTKLYISSSTSHTLYFLLRSQFSNHLPGNNIDLSITSWRPNSKSLHYIIDIQNLCLFFSKICVHFIKSCSLVCWRQKTSKYLPGNEFCQ